MSKLFLMRHGETYFNAWHKIQGWCDSPLTPKGIKQAKEMGFYFAKEKINFANAYCSTAERASDTLELVTSIPYKRLKGLKEQNFGSFEGQDERLNPPAPYGDFFKKYGGESEAEVKQRMIQTLTAIMKKAGDKDNVLVVSHAGAIFNFLNNLGLDPIEIIKLGFNNCSVAELDYVHGQFELKKIFNENQDLQVSVHDL